MKTQNKSKGAVTQQRIFLMSLFAMAALCYFSWYAYRNNKSADETAVMVNNTNLVIQHIERISSTITEIESTFRGYIITGDETYEESTRSLAESLGVYLVQIKKLTKNNRRQQENLQQLESLIDQKLKFVFGIIDEIKVSKENGTATGLKLRGQFLIERIRNILRGMSEEENNLLLIRIGESKEITDKSLFNTIIGGVFSFVFAVILLLRLNKDIRRREIAEAEVRLSETKYRNLIENAGVVMYTTDMRGFINFTSNRATQLTGYSQEELHGMHLSDFINPLWIDKVTSVYVDQIKNNIPESLLEFPIAVKNGVSKWIEQAVVVLYDNDKPVGFQCIARDISERKKMKDELEESEFRLKENQYRLQSILDNTTSLIYIKDIEGRYLLVNERFKQVLNVTDEMVLGKTDYDFSSQHDADKYKVADQKILETKKPLELEESIEMEDGIHNLLIVKFPLLDSEGNIFGISGLGTDITDRVRYQQELIEARKVAENSKKLQEQFLANMSHEIRTPMNGIKGMTDLLLDTPLNLNQEEFVKIIKRSSDNLLVILNDILDFSKIKAGKLTMEKIEFDIREVIKNTQAIFRHKLAENNLSFNIVISESIPGILIGDPYRLSQVLVNLVGNAIKFTEKGSVDLKISLREKNAAQLILDFTIADTGIGIPEENIYQIFESFTQASTNITRQFGGTGLGLTITRQLIQMQGGDIRVESKVNQGSTFQFHIPYGFTESRENIRMATDMEDDGANDYLKDKRILVVEDNEVNQKVIYHYLHKTGIVTDVVNNGREAVDKLNQSPAYDLIIMDLQMPEMDGYEATRYIRETLKLEVPIIAMTATALKGEKTRCLAVGMNDYLSKPFDFSDLYKRMLKLMGGHILSQPIPEKISTKNHKLYDLSSLEELGDRKDIFEVLDLFMARTPGELMEIKEAVTRENWSEVCGKVHKLKSSIGLLGMDQLLAILIQIETNAKSGENLFSLAQLSEEAIKNYNQVKILLEKERRAA